MQKVCWIQCIYIWNRACVCAAGQRHPEGTVDPRPDQAASDTRGDHWPATKPHPTHANNAPRACNTPPQRLLRSSAPMRWPAPALFSAARYPLCYSSLRCAVETVKTSVRKQSRLSWREAEDLPYLRCKLSRLQLSGSWRVGNKSSCVSK